MSRQHLELIVNADDFGMSVGVNEGIIAAHRDGIITSASLMVLQPAAAHAVSLSRSHPGISIGLHVDLCEWVYEDGEWRLLYEVVPLSDAHAVELEIRRQIELFQSLVGRCPTHIDSHQHIHRSEPVRSLILREARRMDIPVRGASAAIQYCGEFYGQTTKGEPYPAGISVGSLAALLRRLPVGCFELACHPAKYVDFQSAYGEERVLEYEALSDPAIKQVVVERGIQLKPFSGRSFDGSSPGETPEE